MRIVFFGTPTFAAEFLKAMLEVDDIEVTAVVTQPDEPVGRKHVLTPPPVKLLAAERGTPAWQPTSMKNPAFHATLRGYDADVFVVIAFGRILPQEILDIPKKGVVNVHPSLLPKFRGPSPLHAAIASGDAETGVCIMLLDTLMDHGPILACEPIALDAKETVETLTKKVVAVGAPLLVSTIRGYVDGTISPTPQDHANASYCKLLTREDGVLHWSLPADVIERKIRAYYPWPGTSTTWMRNGEPLMLKLITADVETARLAPGLVQAVGNTLLIGTGTTALAVTQLQPAGSKAMDAATFLRGYGDIHGTVLDTETEFRT